MNLQGISRERVHVCLDALKGVSRWLLEYLEVEEDIRRERAPCLHEILSCQALAFTVVFLMIMPRSLATHDAMRSSRASEWLSTRLRL